MKRIFFSALAVLGLLAGIAAAHDLDLHPPGFDTPALTITMEHAPPELAAFVEVEAIALSPPADLVKAVEKAPTRFAFDPGETIPGDGDLIISLLAAERAPPS